MVALRKKEAHLWDRDENDWYVEPKVCSLALFSQEDFSGKVWDPACGMGNILKSASFLGLRTLGTDLVNRASACSIQMDFLEYQGGLDFDHIVSNPPFGIAELFVQHALNTIPPNGKVAMILPLVWMAGFSTKRDWLPNSPLAKICPISPRPSMPPGKVIEAGEKPGNGTKDFAWFIWQKGHSGKAEIEFLNTNGVKHLLKEMPDESSEFRNFA